jgi:hypothetical protein
MEERVHDEPSVEAIVTINEDSIVHPYQGFQVMHRDYPAPPPNSNESGIFGNLLDIYFPTNPLYSPTNQEPAKKIRSVAMSEYIDMYQFSNNFSDYISQQPEVSAIMRRTLPARTISVIARQVHHKLFQSLLDRQEAAVQHYGVKISVSTLFNGVIRDELPDESAWTAAYQADPISVQMVIKMLQTSNIDTHTINTIH